jgi:hypothetical protein
MLKVIPISSLLALLFASNCLVVTQAQTRARENRDLVAKQLEQVQIETQSIGSFFSELAISANIPIGLEIAAKAGHLASYGTDFKKGTLSELLNEFVIQHNQYAWEIRDGVVNVFPKDDYRDAVFHNLLGTRIGRFTVKENTSCWTLAETLVSTPEMKKVLEASGTTYRAPDFSGFYIPQVGRHFKLDVSNVTLRSILNRVVEQSPTAKFWVITRNYDGSFNINFGARHEDSPRGMYKSKIPKSQLPHR